MLLGVQLIAQSATTLSVPIPTFLANTGAPCNGCTLTSYAAGTTNQQATYSDKTLATQLPNPIVLDSAGRPQTQSGAETAVYLQPLAYKFVLEDASGSTIWTQDNYQPAQNGIWPLVIGTTTTTAAGITLNNTAITDTKILFQSAGTTEGGLWWNHTTSLLTLGDGSNASHALTVDPATGNTAVGGTLTANGNSVLVDGTWTDYTSSSTITGWASFTTGRKFIVYKKVGHTVFVVFHLEGTSNSTSTSFTLPYTSENSVYAIGAAGGYGGALSLAQDNSTLLTAAGRFLLLGNASTVTCYTNMGTGAWTASGTKAVEGEFWYVTAS